MAGYTLPEGFTDVDMFLFGSALFVGGVLGFLLNAVTVVSFLRVRELRTPSNSLVFNLALADLSLNVNGLTAAYASYIRHWPFGQNGCAYHGFQGMIAVLASISFMAAIAWDRYHQYCTRQKLFWSTSIVMSTIIWVLSIFWAAVPLMGWGVYDFEPMRTCCTLDYTRGDSTPRNPLKATVHTLKCGCATDRQLQFGLVAFQFNTSLPLRVMLMCWGPYVLMCIYACFQNVKVISPKLRMVLPVVAKTNPIFNALLYSFGNEFYRGGVWYFLTGQKIAEPDPKKAKSK
uniref:Retinal G protein coupled receptor b n=1 Tax=Hippocampus comes TaxID=109280 RepID=A0A3Q2Z7T1_HIPCM